MAAKLKKVILGKKLGMTQFFAEDGTAVPVTVLEAGPCVVVQLKPRKDDSSSANVQLGFDEIPENKRRRAVNQPLAGHFNAADVAPQRFLREFRLPAEEGRSVGDKLSVDIFEAGEKVNISGISKGKGFAGGMKRHGFHGGPATHGSMSHRRPASGGGTDAARVFKGVKKPGHMGAVRKTIKGITIVKVDPEKNLLIVKGAVPGAPGGLVEIAQAAQSNGG